MLFCADPVVWARDAQYHCGTKKADVWGQSMPIRIQLDPTSKANNYKAWLLLLSLCHHIHVFRRQVLVTYCWHDCNGGRYCREQRVRIKIALQLILRILNQGDMILIVPKTFSFKGNTILKQYYSMLLARGGKASSRSSALRESRKQEGLGEKRRKSKRRKNSQTTTLW